MFWLGPVGLGTTCIGWVRCGTVWQGKDSLSWWRLRECHGWARQGSAWQGRAGLGRQGEDSFELVAVSVNVKAGQGQVRYGLDRSGGEGRGLARTLPIDGGFRECNGVAA
jgi:hypothetical protein